MNHIIILSIHSGVSIPLFSGEITSRDSADALLQLETELGIPCLYCLVAKNQQCYMQYYL